MTTSPAIGLGGWSAARTAPHAIASPASLDDADLSWFAATVPGTVALALRDVEHRSLERLEGLDASDWWYRCTFTAGDVPDGDRVRLHFGGLATLADVWLNGDPILRSDNMFHAHDVDVTRRLRPENTLVIAFRAIDAALTRSRPRPRWKTRLVRHQQLRWIRTALLGRIPGWSPPVAPVGPWRGVTLHRDGPSSPSSVDVRTRLDGTTGVVEASCHLPLAGRTAVSGHLSVGDVTAPFTVERDEQGGTRVSARLLVEHVSPWWPHTHGRPILYPCTARLLVDGQATRHEWGRAGFRRIEAWVDDGGFGLAVNGEPVFCRGACWTVHDIVSLSSSREDVARELTLMRDAGANMIRVGGTMVYESDDFYDLCDELGLLVWQDFMFANMDYPADDPEFARSVETEVSYQVGRLRRHPSVAVYCGNSEVEQQAAMVGAPREAWRSPLFARTIPEIVARDHAGVPYVPSTPSGGALPFHTSTGVSHYYGVGAYRRPLTDVRRARVRFTPECLGFSNVPDPAVVESVMRGDPVAPHDARWKARVPRDTGAGWDFEDVRDHYLRELFAADPVALRTIDPARYLELGRLTTGEVMARTFAEWRSRHSTCRGALVWFLKDLWPGAGWGVLDSRGRPKACFYALRRVWQPAAVFLTDEGLEGLDVHVANDTDRALTAMLDVALLRGGQTIVARGSTMCAVDARGTARYQVDALLDGFHDVSYAYQFGPPAHDVVVATLSRGPAEVVSEAFWIRDHAAVAAREAGAVIAEARPLGQGHYALTVSSERFLYAAHVDVDGYLPDDNYFSLMPGATKVVRLTPLGKPADGCAGWIEALNLDGPVRIHTHRLVTS